MVTTSKTTFSPYLASGVRLCFLTASSEATTTAAAPSQIPLALPAVTTPPLIDNELS